MSIVYSLLREACNILTQVNNIVSNLKNKNKTKTKNRGVYFMSQKQRHECHRPAGVCTNVSRRRI